MWREKTVHYNRLNFQLIQQVKIAEFVNSCILFENIFRLGYGEVIYPVDSAIQHLNNRDQENMFWI